MRKTTLCLLTTALFTLLAACGDDEKATPVPEQDTGADAAEDTALDTDDREDTTPDAVEDVTADDVTEDVAEVTPDPCEGEIDPSAPGLCLTPTQDGVGADGQDVTAATGAGQVRLGRVVSGHGGVGGVEATCKTGDFVLVNAVSRFCIDGLIPSNQLFFDGGRVVDAEPVGIPAPAGTTGRDRLFIISPFMAFQVGAAERFEIVRDGSDGQLATLRVSGRVEPSSYFAGVVGPWLFPNTGLMASTEYRLRPDSPVLEVVTRLHNAGAANQNVSAGDIPFWGDTMKYVYPGNGDVPTSTSQGLVAYGKGVAYGLFYEDRTFGADLPGLDLPATPLGLASVTLRPDASMTYRRHLIVGEHVGDVLDTLPQVLPGHPLNAPWTTGQVVVTRGGEPLAGAEVVIRPLDGEEVGKPWYADYTGDDGTVPLRLPGGRFRLLASDEEGHEASVDVDAAAASNVQLDLAEGGLVQLDISRVMTVEGGTTPEPSPARLRFWNGQGIERLVFVLRGEASVRLAAGTWSWEASLGMEYTYVQGEVTVTDGGEHTVTAQLEHVVPTPGFVAGEFHQHQTASLDSEVPNEQRVLSNIVEGVDFAVSSDHDMATDFQPIIEALGAEDLIATLAGTEVSPTYGHFGAYPVHVDLGKPARGALQLAFHGDDGTVANYPDGASLVAAMRNQLGAELIQINHPRDSTGYYDRFDFDRSRPASEARAGFSLDVDTMEVINGPGCPQLLDWFALFNQGHRIVGVGNSDTHSASRPPGFPRNYIAASATRPQDLDERAILDGVLSGDVVISASAWLEFGPDSPSDPDGVRPGRLVRATSTTIDVRALTPPWAEVNHLAVVRNGLIVETLEIGGGQEAIVDFDGPITLDTGGTDAWFAVLAWGDARASAVYRGREVYAIANPFFLDADGDGQFSPPGPGPIESTGIFLCE